MKASKEPSLEFGSFGTFHYLQNLWRYRKSENTFSYQLFNPMPCQQWGPFPVFSKFLFWKSKTSQPSEPEQIRGHFFISTFQTNACGEVGFPYFHNYWSKENMKFLYCASHFVLPTRREGKTRRQAQWWLFITACIKCALNDKSKTVIDC